MRAINLKVVPGRHKETLPVVFYEAKANELHSNALKDVVEKLGAMLLGRWIEPQPEIDRESRLEALHPNRPKSEGLRDLGLGRFLNPSEDVVHH